MDAGQRLELAREKSGMSVRGFQKVMYGLGHKGSSYPQIHRYLKGGTKPSMAFLEGAAKVLQVRLAWLATGQGQMSAEEERADAIWSEARQGLGDLSERIHEQVSWINYGGSPTVSTFWEILRQVGRHRMLKFGKEDPGFDDHIVGVAGEVDQYIQQGERIIGNATVDPDGGWQLGPPGLEPFRLAMLNAIVLGITDWLIHDPVPRSSHSPE